MTLTKARKRQLTLSSIGIAFAWALSIASAIVLLPEWLAAVVPATSVIALIVTYVTHRRIRAHTRRASITVEDLHGTPRRGLRRQTNRAHRA